MSVSYLNLMKLPQPIIILMILHLQAELFTIGSCWRMGDANASASCLHKERRALLSMKNAFVDDLGRLSSWGSSLDCCHWSGVLCDPHTGHVEMLHLYGGVWPSQHLRGEISPSLMDLQNLHYLNLSFNDFNRSQIPKFLGSLTKLQYLDLSDSSFGEKIPIELCKLSNLLVLDLSSNGLVGNIPFHLANLSSLQELYLDMNQLAGNIPSQLGNLSSLEILQIGHNYGLKIDDKSLVAIEWLSNLQWLTSLDLSHVSNLNYSNNLLQIIGKLPKLRELGLANCSLTNNNILSTSSSHLNFSTSLSSLDLHDNKLTSALFPWLFNLSSNLTYLSLAKNHLGGPIPVDFGKKMNSLVVLYLYDNELNGTITDIHFDNLTKLKHLSLSRRIPNSIGSLSQLKLLVLRDNCFSGGLPSFEIATELGMLDLGKNDLSGPIPPSWTSDNLKELKTLSLRMNKLDGKLPLHLCYLPKAKVLDLSFNNFRGPIPSCLEKLVAMAQKYVVNDSEYNIIVFKNGNYLVHESFDWKLPMVWKGIERVYKDRYGLVNIDLSHNQLEGEMPTGIVKLVELRFLNLSSNRLSGNIISEIGQLKSLEALDLSRNHFDGEIPSSLAEISSLNTLSLSNNNMTGQIPIGTQLQSFEPSSYEGNPFLCGRPLDNLCPSEDHPLGNATRAIQVADEDGTFMKGFYESLGMGFAVGFWIVFGSLLAIRSWRYAYFNFVGKVSDSIYVAIVLPVAKWRRRPRN
ncbi:receptor-like protein EIX2 [Neltuma alba]|uniref:receptor-like protein EIX2 n=1 Tax=Neltuma alba TaxID=207710 RepID=UPI0010A53CE1|nr:receptor-like protein EIX2 [Prosopis alba]